MFPGLQAQSEERAVVPGHPKERIMGDVHRGPHSRHFQAQCTFASGGGRHLHIRRALNQA